MVNHEELFKALLEGVELQSVYGNGTLILENGTLVHKNKKWEWVNPKDWVIPEVNTVRGIENEKTS
jgi:hypothetical protein